MTAHASHRARLASSLALFAALALAPATACTSARMGLPGTLRADVGDADVERVGTLKVETFELELFWGASGFVGDDNERFGADIARQVRAAGGDGVAHMRYASVHDGCDTACMFATFGFLVPRTYRLTGDIVRIHADAVPGNAPPAPAIPPHGLPGNDDDTHTTPVRF